jgi:hypothetical protein
MEGKEKFLTLKLNILLKHQGCRKAKVSTLGIDAITFTRRNVVHSNYATTVQTNLFYN